MTQKQEQGLGVQRGQRGERKRDRFRGQPEGKTAAPSQAQMLTDEYLQCTSLKVHLQTQDVPSGTGQLGHPVPKAHSASQGGREKRALCLWLLITGDAAP